MPFLHAKCNLFVVLSLKAFSHRAFYNAELGVFEEVAVPGKTSTVESVPHVVSPSSSCSLILTDDNFVAVRYSIYCTILAVEYLDYYFLKMMGKDLTKYI